MDIIVKNYQSPNINEKEILRYAGMKESTPEISKILKDCLAEINGKLNYDVCYLKTPITVSEDIDFKHFKVNSSALKKNLSGYTSAVVFVATVGIEIDRLIKKYSVTSPVKALLFQAIGAERIESLCNAFCEDLKCEYKKVAPRFSAGYGDFSLDYQDEIFKVLNPKKHIGVMLLESKLMLPTKSVTAVVGII